MIDRTGTTENNYLYTGEQYDANVGLYYLRARYYDQSVGRFGTTDPWHGNIFEPVTLHKYLYANANPVMFVDPSGYASFTLSNVMTTIRIASNLYDIGFYSINIVTGNYGVVVGKAAEDAGATVLFGFYGKAAKWSGKLLRKFIGLYKKVDLSQLKLGLNHSSNVLAHNLKVCGVNKPAGAATHHIVGDSQRAWEAKRVLKRMDIDVNSPVNGVFLPMDGSTAIGSLHLGRHLDNYIDEVNERILDAAAGGRDAVLKELADIKLDLLTNVLKLQNQ